MGNDGDITGLNYPSISNLGRFKQGYVSPIYGQFHNKIDDVASVFWGVYIDIIYIYIYICACVSCFQTDPCNTICTVYMPLDHSDLEARVARF